MAGLENIHLNTVYVSSGWEQLGENRMCQYIVLKWQTGAFINERENHSQLLIW